MLKIYEFTSEGPKRTFRKMVEYSETSTKNIYNLAFGDYNEKTKNIDYLSITNNVDSIKVLATVASTFYAFTEKYRKVFIFTTGSTAFRIRLYRMGLQIILLK